jgi:TolB-like protein
VHEPEIAFGPYRLDRGNRSLTRAGVAIRLGGRAFDTLAVLAAAGTTVSKDALLATVWPELIVEENNLQVQISALRKVLGEGWIVTVPGRGYRLVARPAQPAGNPALPDRPSLVVLPFQNIGGDLEEDYFIDGLVEDITTALSCIRSLFVIARNSAFAYKGRVVDLRELGRELGVRYVLQGSVRRAGGRLRITGHLADATSGEQLWARRVDGSVADVFDLQDQVTAAVAGALEP